MKSKKAFLLGEHTLKVIIAVLCLLLLAYLLFRVYSSSKDQRNLELAESTLNELEEKMEEAKTSGKEQEMIVLNPVSGKLLNYWWIIAWPYKTQNKKPERCMGNYCICICGAGDSKDSSLQQCDSLGVCKNFDEKIKTIDPGLIFDWNEPIPIKNPPVEIKIKYNNKEGFEIIEK